MSFAFQPPKARRRPSLTPMIDVVFLLLVFFMLAARFGQEGAVPMRIAGTAAEWIGPPRLVDIDHDGLRLNGVPMPEASLLPALRDLLPEESALTLLRPREGVPLQALLDLMERLRTAGITNLALIAP